MEKNIRACTRRRFLGLSASALAVTQLGSMLVAGPVLAQEQVDPSDPLASGLSYVHDGAQSARAADSDRCGVCLQFTADESAEWGPCNIFGGKHVNAQGWCSAYVPKG